MNSVLIKGGVVISGVVSYTSDNMHIVSCAVWYDTSTCTTCTHCIYVVVYIIICLGIAWRYGSQHFFVLKFAYMCTTYLGSMYTHVYLNWDIAICPSRQWNIFP